MNRNATFSMVVERDGACTVYLFDDIEETLDAMEAFAVNSRGVRVSISVPDPVSL